MDTIILAGGLGTRLKDVVPSVPKPLAPVNGRPFLDIVLEYLERSTHITRVIMAIGYRAEAIKERYADAQYRFPVVFSHEESPLGTGGAIKKALSLATGDDIVVINGDTYADISVDALLRFHRTKSSIATIVVARKKADARYGAVVFDDKHKILSFSEKEGDSDFVSAGTLILRRDLLESIPDNTIYSLEKDLIPRWIALGVYAFIHEGGFLDIGTPESYAEAGPFINAAKNNNVR